MHLSKGCSAKQAPNAKGIILKEESFEEINLATFESIGK